ncbi:type II secretion system protein, partial [Candidatus Gottesmanbacteria bacterium]|nr:type II secretion system protein [Candidatus Gottesmanbacteria bacterium]
MKMQKSLRGFTLVELLVIVALVGMIGVITSQVFIIGFRSAGKGEIVKEVKQNGDYAMSVMETMVRNAADISPDQVCNANSTSLSIINPDGYTTTFDCDPATFNISSASATYPTGIPLMSNKVAVPAGSCHFRVVCPTPPLSPKYVFVGFTLTQGAVQG